MALAQEIEKAVLEQARISADQLESAASQIARNFGPAVSVNARRAWIDKLYNEVVPNVLQQAEEAGLGLEAIPALRAAVTVDPAGPGINPLNQQAFQELLASARQRKSQEQQLADFRGRFEERLFGRRGATLEEAIAGGTGDIAGLDRILRQQQSDIFRKELAPTLRMALGARGLEDSGARVELESKALGGLERSRQERLLEAALGARTQALGLERSDVLGSVASQQQALSNLFDLQRTGLTMEFQRSLEKQRADLARELSQYGGGGRLGSMAGSLGGAAIGAGLGFLGGGISGSLIGTQLGATLGGGAGGIFDYPGG